MRTINTFGEIVGLRCDKLCMVDARQHEVDKVRNMFPELNAWASSYDKLTSLTNKCKSLAVLLPAHAHRYPEREDIGECVMCLEFVGGKLSCS